MQQILANERHTTSFNALLEHVSESRAESASKPREVRTKSAEPIAPIATAVVTGKGLQLLCSVLKRFSLDHSLDRSTLLHSLEARRKEHAGTSATFYAPFVPVIAATAAVWLLHNALLGVRTWIEPS